MSLFILHGDNHLLSRKAYSDQIDQLTTKGLKDIVHLNGKKISLEDIISACEAQSFFATDKIITIDNLFYKSTTKAKKEIIGYLSNLTPQDNHVIIWEPKALTANQLKALSNFKAKLFKTSPAIFKFLDNINPHQPQTYLNDFDQACQKDTAEFVFYMLIKRVRSLIELIDGEPKGAPWQIARLKSQFHKFTIGELLSLHRELFELDYRYKTGREPYDFQSSLLQILIS
jgi:DNA polymerase III delta subunit